MSREPLAHSVVAAGKAIGIGRTKTFQEIHAGRLKAKKVGRKTIVLDSDLRSYCENLPAAIGPRRAAKRGR